MTLNLPIQQTTANGSITGAINGSNRTFTLSGTQPTGMDFFWNGQFLTVGVDYSLSGNTITMLTGAAPSGADILTARIWLQ